jgi:hypothetical protein
MVNELRQSKKINPEVLRAYIQKQLNQTLRQIEDSFGASLL